MYSVFSFRIIFLVYLTTVSKNSLENKLYIYYKYNYKVILYDAREKGRNFYNKYDIKNIINKGVDYIIPDTFYFKNIDKYVIKRKG